MSRFMPRSATARTFLAATALALAGGSFAAGAADVIGINAVVLNNVRIKPAGTTTARTAVVRQRVALADEVQTGGKSQLQVLLLDKSVFTVGANARLTIDRFVYDPARGARAVGASVVTGAFRFMSGKPDAKGSSSIRTPVATIGIRGTILDGVVGEEAVRIAAGEAAIGPNVESDPTTASLIILRGPGRAAQGRVQPGVIDITAAGRTVTIDRPMRAVYVPRPGAAPIGPFLISPEGLREVQALIFPSLAPRFGIGPDMAGQPYYPVEDRPRPLPPFEPGRGPTGYPSDYPQGYPGTTPMPRGPGSYVPSLPSGYPGPTGQQRPQTQPTPQARSTPQSTTVQQTSNAPLPALDPAPSQAQTPTQPPPTAQDPVPTPAPTPTPKSAPPPNPNQSPNNQAPAPSPSPTPSRDPVGKPNPNGLPPGK